MKRMLSFVLIMLLALALAGCANGEANPSQGEEPPIANSGEIKGVVFHAKIIEVDENSVLLAALEGAQEAPTLCRFSLEGIPLTDQNGKGVSATALATGMTVDVDYDGSVLETYPAQLGNVFDMQITGQGNDLVGFYCGVLQDLYDKDPGLNDGISMLAFDLTAVQNLTSTEKEAFIWVAKEQFDLETVASTSEELTKQGLIDQEAMYFTNGLLIKIEDEPSKNDSFKFSANKWRGGLGAYYFVDCTAKKANGQWSYTIGSEMIS